jgi:flagellar motor protein MotB
MQEKTNGFFWPGYVDLLTTLFAAVLVLFVLSFKLYQEKEKKLQEEKLKVEVYAQQYQRIQQIDQQIKALEKQGSFVYDTVYKRFLVKGFIGKEIFDSGSYAIRPPYQPIALQAGRDIKDLVNSFLGNPDISFVVLVEGNTAKKNDGTLKGTIDANYLLSYHRSLTLRHLWEDNDIHFGVNTELIISGSGVYGVGRDPTEENNKRFLIQVIPKIKK